MQPKLWQPLAEDWQPGNLLFRDQHLNKLIEYTVHPVPNNVYLQGEQGLGKTLTTKFFEKEVSITETGKVFTINWERKMIKALSDANDRYALKIAKQDLDARSFASALIATANGTVYLVIDEPEKSHRMRYVSDFVHTFYNSMVQHEHPFSLIFVSRMIFPKFRRFMASDTLSRLRPVSIVFSPYKSDEIIEILKQRLDVMFDDEPYDVQSLRLLAEHIQRIGGDIRQALQILSYAIKNAEDMLSVDVMEKAIEWGKNRWWSNQINSLPNHQAYLLFCAALQTNNGSSTLQKNAVKRYTRSCSELGISPVGYTTLCYHFRELAKKGFVAQEDAADKRDINIIFPDKNDKKHIIRAGAVIDWSYCLLDGTGRETPPQQLESFYTKEN